MKKFFQILALLSLTLTSFNVISFNNLLVTQDVKFKRQHSHPKQKQIRISYIDIPSPLPTGSFFLAVSNTNNCREIRVWRYITLVLLNLQQEQIIGIQSLYNDSFNMHIVPSYIYNKYDPNAGINVMLNFRQFLFLGNVTLDWDFDTAFNDGKITFESCIINNSLTIQHLALATIKFQWYYDNNDLIIDIVGTLLLRNNLMISELTDTALFQLGSWFRIYYWSY